MLKKPAGWNNGMWPLLLDLERSKVNIKNAKIPRSFCGLYYVAKRLIYFMKTPKFCLTVSLSHRCVLQVKRSQFKPRTGKCRNRFSAVILPRMVQSTLSTHHNILVPGRIWCCALQCRFSCVYVILLINRIVKRSKSCESCEDNSD